MLGFEMPFEVHQPGSPEDPVVRQPLFDPLERLRIEGVDPGLGHPPFPQESRLTKHPEVARHGRPADREEVGNVSGRQGALAQGIQNGAAGRIGNGAENRAGGLRNHWVT